MFWKRQMLFCRFIRLFSFNVSFIQRSKFSIISCLTLLKIVSHQNTLLYPKNTVVLTSSAESYFGCIFFFSGRGKPECSSVVWWSDHSCVTVFCQWWQVVRKYPHQIVEKFQNQLGGFPHDIRSCQHLNIFWLLWKQFFTAAWGRTLDVAHFRLTSFSPGLTL